VPAVVGVSATLASFLFHLLTFLFLLLTLWLLAFFAFGVNGVSVALSYIILLSQRQSLPKICKTNQIFYRKKNWGRSFTGTMQAD
jgi:hypothetical protein